jgi:hypothetical protein
VFGKIYSIISQVFFPHEILPRSLIILQFPPPHTYAADIEFFVQVLHTKASFVFGLTYPSPFDKMIFSFISSSSPKESSDWS